MERARLEAEERDKREFEKREREKEMEMKARMAQVGASPHSSHASQFEAQIAAFSRRYGAHGGPPPTPFGLFPPPPPPNERDRLVMPPVSAAEAVAIQEQQMRNADRLAALSASAASDPLMRLQMANLASELHNHAHTHAHTHAHAHTHLHLHPGKPSFIFSRSGLPLQQLPPLTDPVAIAAAAAAAGISGNIDAANASRGLHTPHNPLLPSGSLPPGMRPPGLGLPTADPALLHPGAAGLLRPPFDEQLAHQVNIDFSLILPHIISSSYYSSSHLLFIITDLCLPTARAVAKTIFARERTRTTDGGCFRRSASIRIICTSFILHGVN